LHGCLKSYRWLTGTTSVTPPLPKFGCGGLSRAATLLRVSGWKISLFA
jgi:hypothetical protein